MTYPTTATPFEHDIAGQPDALRRLARSTAPDLSGITGRTWGRIVLTGMGSSHFAALPTWRRLIARGLPAWTIDTGQLLGDHAVVTADTLLVVTSQSGASGEVTELLARRAEGDVVPAALVGVTDDTASPLARAADLVLPLHSGPEATVTTKSYLNTVGVHRRLSVAFADGDLDGVDAELLDTATTVEDLLENDAVRTELADVARATVEHPAGRLAFVGVRDTAATAQFAALIVKESAKVVAEGYTSGQFRHGPFELAGDGLTAVVFFPDDDPADPSLHRLCTDLVQTGSRVVAVGGDGADATTTIPVRTTSPVATAAAGAVVVELFAVELARANQVEPGVFVYGSKITTKT